jgi:hypothetical protein
MTTIIDVDCHFDVPIAPDEHPLAAYADQLPPLDAFIADSLTGDLLHQTPEASRPRFAELTPYLPENTSSAEQAARPGSSRPVSPVTGRPARVARPRRHRPRLRQPGRLRISASVRRERSEAVRRCNDFMADRLRATPIGSPSRSSTGPTSTVDRGWRGCAKGSRAFWVRAEPLDAVAPGHPALDPLWATATDLGMIAILHVGNVPTRFDGGWGDMGWERPGSTGAGGFFRYANSFRHQAAEMTIGAMVYGGVRPSSEPHRPHRGSTSRGCPGSLSVASLDIAGPWPFDLAPSEMLRRNVRARPCRTRRRQRARRRLHRAPGHARVLVRLPARRGNPDPIDLYEPQLSALDPDLRAQFLGENIAACFARMGDPLAKVKRPRCNAG